VDDAINNGMPLPSDWHYNHPSYDNWIRSGLDYLKANGGINLESLAKLREAAIFNLNNGVNQTLYPTINQFWQNAITEPFGLIF
jgi:hypothetical protein